jgi:hypothetical protein
MGGRYLIDARINKLKEFINRLTASRKTLIKINGGLISEKTKLQKYGVSPSDKGKTVERQRRKTAGLRDTNPKTARSPKIGAFL